MFDSSKLGHSFPPFTVEVERCKIHELTLAIGAGIGLTTIARTIHPYPTQAEAIRKIADAYNRTRLTPRVSWIFRKWLAWTR